MLGFYGINLDGIEIFPNCFPYVPSGLSAGLWAGADLEQWKSVVVEAKVLMN